jgi:RecB family endonuclease NucS
LAFLYDEGPISEKELQILYQTHPYLIEKKFLDQKTVPQYTFPSGFADIVVFLETEIVIIELKVEPLENPHILQLNGYLEDAKREFKNVKIRGILIGKPPKKDLNKALNILPFKIKMMILNRDISTKIKICDNCRLANDIDNIKCVFCSSNSFL